MSPKNDLRIIKTKKALYDAFVALLSRKKFEDISVSELCGEALVRRATFYKHFSDKYDFFAFFVKETVHNLMIAARANQIIVESEEGILYLYAEGVNFLTEHSGLVQSVLNSNMLGSLMEIMSDEIYHYVFHILQKMKDRGKNLPTSIEFLASFYTGAIVQTLRYNVIHSSKMSKEELIEHFAKALHGLPF